MSTMTVTVFVNIIERDCCTPDGATFEFDVVNVDTGVDDVDVYALSALRVVLVLGEGAEGKFATMADSSKTLLEEFTTRRD